MQALSRSTKTWVYLDGAKMHSRDSLHDHLKDAFDFPDYYGRNLDAAWDLLSTWQGVLWVYVSSTELLDSYGLALLSLLKDLEKERGQMRLICDTAPVLPQGNADMLYSV